MNNHNKFSHTIVMLLVCIFPLFLFFILAVNGVKLSPVFFLIFIVICCAAMYYFMGDMHTKEGAEHEAMHHEVGIKTVEQSENFKKPVPVPENIGDVFHSDHVQRVDDTLIYEGHLLTDADTAYKKLKESSDQKNISTLLQEDDAGRTILIISEKKDIPKADRPSRPFVPSGTVNLILFILTFITTTYAGALQQGVNLLNEPGKFNVGLPYAIALMVILGAHELGHYFAAKKHNMKVTLPYFIPVPFALGTFGAFIQMKSVAENRKALFDVGVAGPIAGLVFAIPALIIGLQGSTIIPMSDQNAMMGGADIGSSILLALIAKISVGKDLISGHTFQFSPLAFAGWLGLFVTALNLLPIGQLDGGHIAHALFGRKNGNTVGTVALFALFILGLFVWSGLLTWAIIVFFLAGIKSTPPLNDVSKLDGRRVAIGLFAFIILFIILIPVPHSFYQSLGINCPYV